MEKAEASGLTWPKPNKPVWRASRSAIKAGFSPQWVNLRHLIDDEVALVARCQRLTAEMNVWLSGRRDRDLIFDGTVASLIRFYQTETNSGYHKLEPATRVPYDVYLRMIHETVGQRRIDMLDGRDLQRWHAEWSSPSANGRPRIAAARKLAFFHQNIFCALDTTERSQGLVKFIYSRSQPVFMENLRARNGETCQHRACGKLNGRCSVGRGAQSRRSLRHTARCLCTTSDVSSPMSPLATIRPVSRIANF
jgi:hypothetical protein